ncbi:MAG: oligosaccharide flippase family protein [Polyangiales bacterium]
MDEVDEARREQASASYRIARNAASLLASNAAGEVLTSYSLVIAAVSLGPAGFGLLSEAQAFMEPFESLAGLGLGSVSLTLAARRGGCDGTLRGTVWGIRALSGVLAAAIGIAAGFVLGRAHLWPLLITFAVGMLFTPITAISNLPYQYNRTVHKRLIVPFLVSVVRLTACYVALWTFNVPLGYQLAALCATVAAAVLQRLWARRDYPEPLSFDHSLASELLRLGWPAAVLELVVSCYSRASYFLLHHSGAEVQGAYAAADRLTRPVLALAAALFLSSLPSLAQLAVQRDFVQLRAAYRRTLVRVVLGLTPILTAAWFLAAWLLARFVPVYSGAIWPFRILLVGTFFMFMNQLSSGFVMALGKFRIIMTVAIINLGVYLALAPSFIAQYGASGAALAVTTMEGVNTLMQLFAVYWLLRRD